MKKLISLTLATIFAMMCLFVSVSAEGNVLGDANGDGKVTTTDARMVLRCSTRLDPMDTILKELCDLNGDDKITTADARLILRVATRLDNAECLVNGHAILEKTVAATCSEQGNISKVCSRCNAVIETKDIPPLGHKFSFGKCEQCGAEESMATVLNLKWPISEELQKIAIEVTGLPARSAATRVAEGTDITGTKRVLYEFGSSISKNGFNSPIRFGYSLEASEFGRMYRADGTIEPRCNRCGKLPSVVRSTEWCNGHYTL